MKILISLFLVSLPAAAQACGMSGGVGQGGGQGCGGGHAAVAVYAALAVLGYWILQHAAKETATYVKRAGVTVGMTLVVISLFGFLCGVRAHIKTATAPDCSEMMRNAQGEMPRGGAGMMIRDGQEMMKRGGQGGGTGQAPAISESKSPAPAPAKKKDK
ncbi:MAG: hypothetical protein Q7R35_15865 [Elusimicrobiota bacterium]|nr:hypothetical protein [Elusimicrobiota bacterium]